MSDLFRHLGAHLGAKRDKAPVVEDIWACSRYWCTAAISIDIGAAGLQASWYWCSSRSPWKVHGKGRDNRRPVRCAASESWWIGNLPFHRADLAQLRRRIGGFAPVVGDDVHVRGANDDRCLGRPVRSGGSDRVKRGETLDGGAVQEGDLAPRLRDPLRAAGTPPAGATRPPARSQVRRPSAGAWRGSPPPPAPSSSSFCDRRMSMRRNAISSITRKRSVMRLE